MLKSILFSLLIQVVLCKNTKTIPRVDKPGKTIKVCGTSFCDSDMLSSSARHGAWHVPNLVKMNSQTAWASNVVNGEKIITVTNLGTSNVNFGGFCSKSQKTTYFLGAFVPVNIAAPSWVANIPAGDLDLLGDLVSGASYKLDVTVDDITAMNNMATFCQTTCINTKNCNYGQYGWEDGSWFCKLYSKGICTDSLNMWWRPSTPGFPVTSVGGKVTSTAGFSGGCRVTDTVSVDTPYINPGVSLAISPNTPYTLTLPYVNQQSYTRADNIVASIKCDVSEGVAPAWPTYGTVWI